jgi:hypothetical protein
MAAVLVLVVALVARAQQVMAVMVAKVPLFLPTLLLLPNLLALMSQVFRLQALSAP